MRVNFVKSMAMQVEAQIHEKSKLWSTSQPFAKLIRDARKKTRGRNPITSIFAWLCENFAQHGKLRGGAAVGLRAGLSERQFRTPYETTRGNQRISHTMGNFAWTPLDFYLQIFCVISYFLLVINLDIFFYIFLYLLVTSLVDIERHTDG